MYSVYQHWDPLKVCVVGRSYPPEFYSWIKDARVRSLFEKIAIETEEDYQNIIRKLESFGVKVLRPTLTRNYFINGKYLPPPMTPRDYMIMIGEKFYKGYQLEFYKFYNSVKDESWPECKTIKQFDTLPNFIKNECIEVHNLDKFIEFYSSYDDIFDHIKHQGNQLLSSGHISSAPGAYITRVGKDLYFRATPNIEKDKYLKVINSEFLNTRNHIVDVLGHSDATFCPVCPGLIISLNDVPTYADTFPDWEVVYLPDQSWNKVQPFLDLKCKNQGAWWIPGFEYDQAVIDVVETWMKDWVGFVEETVFDVNMLIVNPKNVIVFNYNKQVFDALDRYGITPHVVPFRHRYFWDGGIHCVTCDLHREGSMCDFFPNRCI